jgi:hypothetical protein
MTVSTTTARTLFLAASISVLASQAPKRDPDAAPIPSQILTARSVFLSNRGVDAADLQMIAADEPYNKLYAAMKSWGKYEITDAPSKADLVLEIRVDSPASASGRTSASLTQVQLRILDGKTHFTLWTFVEAVPNAIRKPTWEKNLDQTIAHVVADLKDLAAAK